MSTELDIEQAAQEWLAKRLGFEPSEARRITSTMADAGMFAAFHKHMLSLPQQDVGAGRYEVGDMVVFTDSAWVFRPNEDIGAHPNARNPRRVLAPPDRHGHFRIDGTDVDYATGIWVGSDEITLHSRAAVRSVPSPVGQAAQNNDVLGVPGSEQPVGLSATSPRAETLSGLSASIPHASGWVSVKDRLPEVGQWVLASVLPDSGVECLQTVARIRGISMGRLDNSIQRPDWQCSALNAFSSMWRHGSFTHWMPLPENPEHH